MSESKNRVGIIGASGFLGLNLARYLSENPHYDLVLTSRTSSTRPIPESSNVKWVVLDLNDAASIQSFLHSVDRVVYLAHQGLPTREENWKDEVQNNLTPFTNFLEQVRIQKRSTPLQVIYLSSGGAIYGSSDTKKPWLETDQVVPTTTYGMLKLSAEQYLRHAVDQGSCTGLCLRVSNPYGNHFPHFKDQGIIDVAATKILANQPLRLFSGLDFVRDFIHINDLNRALEASLQLTTKFEILNIGSGVGHTLKEVLSGLETAFHRKLTIETIQPDTNTKAIPWSVLDISKAKKTLTWKPTITLQEGLEKVATQRFL